MLIYNVKVKLYIFQYKILFQFKVKFEGKCLNLRANFKV
jgi:hypothetical protein